MPLTKDERARLIVQRTRLAELVEKKRLLVERFKPDAFTALGYEPLCKTRHEAGLRGEDVPLCGQCPQEQFHAATEDDVLYGGAAGGGKSKALVAEAIKWAHRYAGLRAGIFRRTYDELAESIFPALASLGYARALGGRWNKNDRELTFPSGSVVRCRYADEMLDASHRQGGEYQFIGVDERTLMNPGVVDLLKERLRTVGDSGIPVIGLRSTSNPGGASHGEVKSRYIEGTQYGRRVVTDEFGQTIRFIPAKATDNYKLGPEYYRILDAIPDPARRAAMRDGSWDTFSGQVFTEWSRDRHVVTPWALPETWERYMGVDYGGTKPFAVVWFAIDEDGRQWIYRELYAAGVGEHEQARRIREAEMPTEKPYRVGDSAMWGSRGDAASIAEAYSEEGIWLEPAEKGPGSRLTGLARCHTYMADAPPCLHHRSLGWETCPRVHVFSSCVEFIRSIPSLPYDVRKVEDVDTNADDHIYDAWRYATVAVGTGAEWHFPDDAAVRRVGIDGETPVLEELGPYGIAPEDLRPATRREAPIADRRDGWG